MSDNEIGDGGLEGLARALKRNTAVRLLELCFNRISSAGAETLAKSVWGCRTLTALRLDNNQVCQGEREACFCVCCETCSGCFDVMASRSVRRHPSAVYECSRKAWVNIFEWRSKLGEFEILLCSGCVKRAVIGGHGCRQRYGGEINVRLCAGGGRGGRTKNEKRCARVFGANARHIVCRCFLSFICTTRNKHWDCMMTFCCC